MKEITITKNEAGQRLDKFLLKYLNRAPASLIHKYLRKKDIRLNGRRAQGDERLKEGDSILIRLPDAQMKELSGKSIQRTAYPHIDVLYEDEQILLLNKPAGVLTQQAHRDDISLNEEMLSYLLDSGAVTSESLRLFRPSVCNRLDRNTSGIVICAKTLPAAQEISEMIRERRIEKFYQCIVIGTVDDPLRAEGWLIKDEQTNRVRILDHSAQGSARIVTGIRPLCTRDGYSRLQIELITGKPHQIRAQLSALGHPVAGDPKYGGRMQGLHHQALTAYKIVFPVSDGALSAVSGRSFEAPLPPDFIRLIRRLKLS